MPENQLHTVCKPCCQKFVVRNRIRFRCLDENISSFTCVGHSNRTRGHCQKNLRGFPAAITPTSTYCEDGATEWTGVATLPYILTASSWRRRSAASPSTVATPVDMCQGWTPSAVQFGATQHNCKLFLFDFSFD